MKKIFLALSVWCTCHISIAQNSIKSDFDAAVSNRYLKWEDIDHLGYRVRIFEKQNDGTFLEKEETVVRDNFFRVSRLYLSSKYQYRIEGLSSAKKTVITDSDVYSMVLPDPGDYGNFWVCSKTCNGTDYAYTLNSYGVGIYVDENNDGIPDVDENNNFILDDTGRRFMYLSGAAYAYSNEEGDASPFYMAMDYQDFQAYSNLYMQIFNDQPEYFTHTGFVGASEGYRDREGYIFVGENPRIVHKTTLQYEWMNGNRTSEVNYSDNMCSAPMGGSNFAGWIGTWNENMSEYADNPINQNPNTDIYMSELSCDGPSLASGDDVVTPFNWEDALYESWYDCFDNWEENGFPDELVDCVRTLDGGNPGGGNPLPNFNEDIAKIFFIRVDGKGNEGVTIEWALADANDFYVPNNLRLQDGLYKMYTVFSDGKIMPYIFHYQSERLVEKKVSDYVSMEVVPNPIQNNTLKLDLASEKKINYTLQIYSLDGLVLMTETGFMNANSTKNVNLSIPKNKFPYNQIRVVLTFDDGSEIQKIAYRAN